MKNKMAFYCQYNTSCTSLVELNCFFFQFRLRFSQRTGDTAQFLAHILSFILSIFLSLPFSSSPHETLRVLLQLNSLGSLWPYPMSLFTGGEFFKLFFSSRSYRFNIFVARQDTVTPSQPSLITSGLLFSSANPIKIIKFPKKFDRFRHRRLPVGQVTESINFCRREYFNKLWELTKADENNEAKCRTRGGGGRAGVKFKNEW